MKKETNIFEGYRCPSCHNDEVFVFDATGSIELRKDGSWKHIFENIGLDQPKNYAACPKCEYRGIWSTFSLDLQNVEEAPVLHFMLSWWNMYSSKPVSITKLRSLAYTFRLDWRYEEGKEDKLPDKIMHSRIAMSGNITVQPRFVESIDGKNFYALAV